MPQIGFDLVGEFIRAPQHGAVLHDIVIRARRQAAGADGQIVKLGLGDADQRLLAVAAFDCEKRMKWLHDRVLLALACRELAKIFSDETR